MKIFRELDPQLRRSLLILFVAALFFWSSLTTLLPTLPLYVQSVGGTNQQIGLVMGAFAIGLLLSRVWLGQLADAKGRKLVLRLGALVAFLAPLCYLLTRSIPLLLAIRVFHGISIAAFGMAYTVLVADLSPQGRKGEIIGYMNLSTTLGIAIGPAIGGYVQARSGYPPLFAIASALALLALVCCFWVWEPKRSLIATAHSAPGASSEKSWQILWSKRIGIPALVLLAIGFIYGTLTTFMPLFMQETKVNLNPGLFYTTAAIVSFAIGFKSGRASDRYGRGLLVAGGLLCYALAMFCLWTANSSPAFLLGAVFYGCGGGTVPPTVYALIADRSAPHERGRLFSLCVGGFDLGMAIAGPTFGVVAEQLGYRNIFAFSMGFACLVILIFITQSSQDLPASIKFAIGQAKDAYALKN